MTKKTSLSPFAGDGHNISPDGYSAFIWVNCTRTCTFKKTVELAIVFNSPVKISGYLNCATNHAGQQKMHEYLAHTVYHKRKVISIQRFKKYREKKKKKLCYCWVKSVQQSQRSGYSVSWLAATAITDKAFY